MMRRERVFELNGFFGMAASADGNWFRHVESGWVEKKNEPPGDGWLPGAASWMRAAAEIQAAGMRRAASIPSSAFHKALAAFSPASRALSADSGFCSTSFPS